MAARAMSGPWTLTARWIFPVSGPPLERGSITVQGERIVAVSPRGARAADEDLGTVAILPGLVNAHTHLDLSDLRGQVNPGIGFIAWLRAVVAHRRRQQPEQARRAVARGVRECLRFGTTLVGDISAQGLSWKALQKAPLRAVVFFEMIGLRAERAGQSLHEARAWLKATPPTSTCRRGLSPHAPYSVRTDLFARATSLARAARLPLAVHLAETQAELELLLYRRGPFKEFLTGLDAWEPNALARSPAAVTKLCAAPAVPKLFVHGNFLPPSVRLPTDSAVVYCPRTHAAFGHPPHPFRGWLRRGLRIALGTDSLASNPDLDVLAEARFLHARYPNLAGATLLRMATLSGAEAFGWDDVTGSLTAGKSADLIVLPLPDREERDPHLLVLDSTLAVQRVLCRGRWVFRAPLAA